MIVMMEMRALMAAAGLASVGVADSRVGLVGQLLGRLRNVGLHRRAPRVVS